MPKYNVASIPMTNTLNRGALEEVGSLERGLEEHAHMRNLESFVERMLNMLCCLPFDRRCCVVAAAPS